MIKLKTVLCVALGATLSGGAYAKVSPEEAKKLGNELTPSGAERAGNADGSIPEWDGGLTIPPASFQLGQHATNPFPADKVLFTINASNAEQYQEQLSPGQLAMLKAYPDSWKMNVYQTRRTHANPEHVYEATRNNAITAELIDNGNGISGAVVGVPFPIPKGASEVIWNHLTRYRGETFLRYLAEAAVEKNGSFSTIRSRDTFKMRYAQQGMTADALENIMYFYKQWTISPSRLAGDVVLVHDTMNQVAEPRKAWVYDPGQRRVRRAPTVAYDGPGPGRGTEGFRVTDNYDMFNGAQDRYDWKLIGKQELFIPYNSYKLHSDPAVTMDNLIQPKHLNPEPLRYELHRVWVVEGVLKDTARHIYAKRIFYVDEDSWQIAITDHYDGHGELWRVGEAHALSFYRIPLTWLTAEVLYDLISNKYIITGNLDRSDPVHEFNDELTLRDKDFTPAALRREGR